MASRSGSDPELSTDRLLEQPPAVPHIPEGTIQFQVVPAGADARGGPGAVRWRVRFERSTVPAEAFGLDIYDDVVLGRGDTGPDYVDLSRYDALTLGVSRRHLVLRPTATRLYIIDLGSTNGTRRNGQPIGRNIPYGLGDGDSLSLGTLQFVVRLVERPRGQTTTLHDKADLADAMAETASAITSQLELDEVLKQVAERALILTSADQAGVWLADEQTGEIRLEGQQGIEDESLQRMATDSMIGSVIKTGRVVQRSRSSSESQIKLKTGRFVDALLLVPISLAGVTIGVLGTFRLRSSTPFGQRDENLVTAIARFAAIAVQNARLYQTTDRALARRVAELAALNDLSHAVSSSLDLTHVHEVLITHIHKHWQVEDVLLWLVDEESHALKLFPSNDPAHAQPSTPPMREEAALAVAARVVKTGEPESADFAAPGESEVGDGESTLSTQARSLACVPLMVQGRGVGALALLRRRRGSFTSEDLTRLQPFANSVATAIHNARLFTQSEHEREIVRATANTLSQPLIILGETGDVVLSNETANELLKSNMNQVFQAISGSIGKTAEFDIGQQTYLTTVEHSSSVGTIAVMQDVTYLKQLEETRAELVHALSHDLKSPVTSITGYAQLIQRVDTLSERSKQFLDGILSAAKRIQDMIAQLLDVALLSEGAAIGSELCDVVEVVERAQVDLAGAALQRSMTVAVKVEGEPYAIRGDATRLYRSVLNLIDNAIKYSTPDTPILITLRYGREQLTLEVLDDGPGIPEEDIGHVFEKYYRGKQSVDVKGGHGLGLVLVRATARAHGGEATVANVPGHGAAFTMTFPATLRTP